MKWWRDARFGMFIHWGVYAVPAGDYKGQRFDHIGEWIMLDGHIPVAEYRALRPRVQPGEVRSARRGPSSPRTPGMKYIVITSKHHDGFALFPSDATDWDIADATPYGKDLIGPLAEAAREQRAEVRPLLLAGAGLDAPRRRQGAGTSAGEGWDPAHDGDFDEYLDEIAIPQVREILTRYKPDVLWWDTPVEMNPERAERLAAAAWSCAPTSSPTTACSGPTTPATSTRPSSGSRTRASTATGKRA